jgi:hypothetical protein
MASGLAAGKEIQHKHATQHENYQDTHKSICFSGFQIRVCVGSVSWGRRQIEKHELTTKTFAAASQSCCTCLAKLDARSHTKCESHYFG